MRVKLPNCLCAIFYVGEIIATDKGKRFFHTLLIKALQEDYF